MAEIIANSKKKKVVKTVKQLTVDGNFSPNEFWKLKKIMCPQSKMEKISVLLENGDEVIGDEAVKGAYELEFQNRLRHNKIHPEYNTYEEMTNELSSVCQDSENCCYS